MRHRLLSFVSAGLVAAWCAPCTRAADAPGPRISVWFDSNVRATPASGRLVVYLLRPDAKVGKASPADAPFFDDPQPCFGVDVIKLAPGEKAVVDDSATSFPVALGRLPKGTYKAQAVLDLNSEHSDWQREPGNLYSEIVTFSTDPADPPSEPLEIALTKVIEPEVPVATDGFEYFEITSALLSEFHGRPIKLRAGVVLPLGRKAGGMYAAVYEIPGYGGDWRTARMVARFRNPTRMSPEEQTLWGNCYRIVLDAESGNGHTLWANSINNGPWATALVSEFIPALEKQFNLIARPEARLLTGHSSGGWSSLWLQLNYPDFFGGAWSGSPDPVDFRRFQRTNIYAASNMYSAGDPAAELPSYTSLAGEVRMTVRTENLVEEVIGSDNTSGQQWDSWQAAFGPKGPGGHAAALYDPVSGAIDRSVAEQYRKYDISDLLRKYPDRFGAVLRDKVRLVVGDRDNYGLNEAVQLLKQELEGILRGATPAPTSGRGYIKVLPGDHGTVMGHPEYRRKWIEMELQLQTSGVIAK